MSIIGESFDSNVSEQILVRQQLQGKQTRDNVDLNLLNNQNAWLKLASSVRIISQTDAEKESGISGSIPSYDPKSGTYVEEEENISKGEQRLRDLGITNTGLFTGNQLARKAVLFNTLTEVNPATYNETGKISEGSHTFRSGVIDSKNLAGSLWNNKSYGLGSTNFGIVPSPGLISAKVNCKNRGSIREATVVIKAYNLFQFELIELLYLRLGYTMMLEWGWDKFQNSKGELQKMGNTIIEDLWFQDFESYNYKKIINDVARYRKIYNANYDGFLGKVVNFDWSFQPDGTYDITLKLITVGDVIESLKVNLPSNLVTASQLDKFLYQGNTKQTSTLRKLNSPIITNAGSSTLSVDLFTDVAKSKPDKWWEYQGGYFGLFSNLSDSGDYKIQPNYEVDKLKEDETIKYPPTGTDSNKFNYYLTFYELLEKLNRLCVPSINGGKMLRFSTGGDEICSYFPNQVSFDPKVCLIKPQFDEPINASSKEDLKNKTTCVKNNYISLDKLKPFLPEESEKSNPKVLYGNIMNIYLNYNFVSEVLEKNTKNGDISIFKFLQSICNGVNSALGGFNKLEPVIEEDNKVKIIDQNTIPGIENSTKFGNRFNNTPPFEIFGYSTGLSGSSVSNFVTDFSFKTKIGPELASMITIGATAANKKTKNYDGTAFSKWNDGLEDAYALAYKNPEQNTFKEEGKDTYPFTNSQIAKMSEKFRAADLDFSILPDALAFSLLSRYGINTLRDDSGVYSEKYGIKIQGIRDIEDCPISHQDYNNVTWEEYTEEVAEWIDNQKDPIEELEATEINNYLGWLVQAFGGKINKKSVDSKLYFYLNDDFYKIGKEVFKAFINSSNNNNYRKTKNPSNTIGFIPADLGLTIDGLSGVKIYNALSINQRFLPKSYPSSLKFIITKVDHDISSNNWKTSLGTISVPKTNPPEISNYEGVSATLENQSTALELSDVLGSVSARNIQKYDNKDRIDINQLSTSPKGIEEIKKRESFRTKAYDDFKPNVSLTQNTVIEGTLTIGYGFTKAVIPSLSWNSTITQSEADALLIKTLKNDYEKRVRRDIKVPLRQSEFDALVNVVFNAGEIGNSSAGNSTPLKNYINTKRYREAAEILPFYRTTSKGIPLAGLVRRREEERSLYLSFGLEDVG